MTGSRNALSIGEVVVPLELDSRSKFQSSAGTATVTSGLERFTDAKVDRHVAVAIGYI
jgi:hypothetical protein